MREIQIKASRLGARLLRNQTGAYKIGKRWISYGVGGKGGSDLIGWTPIEITPDMVGRTIAVFSAIEVKVDTPTTKEQVQFLEAVIRNGGIGLVCRSSDDLRLDNII